MQGTFLYDPFHAGIKSTEQVSFKPTQYLSAHSLVSTTLSSLHSFFHIITMVSFTLPTIIAVAAFFAQSAVAAPSPRLDATGVYAKRAASCTFPSPPKTSSLSAPMSVKGTFDGKSHTYMRILAPYSLLRLFQAATFATTAARALALARRREETRTPCSCSRTAPLSSTCLSVQQLALLSNLVPTQERRHRC
jgi:hypothetical protein